MKNKKPFIIFTLSILAFSFTACLKKGADDPAISLRTRKARVVGDWKLSSGTETQEQYSAYGSSQKMSTTYDGAAFTTVTEQSGTSNFQDIENGTFTLKMSFKKNGNFEMQQILNGDLTTIKGSWNFTGKVGKFKNKEQIVLHYTSSVGPDGTNTSSGNETNQLFELKELRSKKMVLVFETGSTNTNTSSNGAVSTNTSSARTEYTLEQ